MATKAQLTKDFLALQEERVQEYAKLGDAHKTYLGTGPDYDLIPYRQAVHDATEKFKVLSTKIIAIRKSFEDDQSLKDKDVANFITKVQQLEEQKLRFTVEHQLAMEQAKDNPEDDLMAQNAQGLRKKLNGIAEDISEALEEVRYHLADLQEEDNCR